MSRCFHVFIIWSTAQNFKMEILQEIRASFTIVKQLEVHWSREHFSENITSFYEEDFRNDLFQLRERGTGPLHVVIVEDHWPVYHEQISRRGLETVNTNVLRVKQSIRENMTRTFNFHASINEQETRNNIVKLTGESIEDFIASTDLDGGVEVMRQDCPGVGGWNSLAEMFYVLNECHSYVVLRGFHALPYKHRMKKEGDIDVLVSDLPAFLNLILPGREFADNAFRFFNWMDIGDQNILIHPKFVGDNYYDRALQQRILDTRIKNNQGIYIPRNDLYFWSLLYHGLFHKENYQKYAVELSRIASEIGVIWKDDKEYLCGLLSNWMLLHRYEARLHLDGVAGHLQPQNFRYGLDDRSSQPRIFAFTQHFNGAPFLVVYVSETLLRHDERLFTSFVRSRDSLCDLHRHALDPRSDLYHEFTRRQQESGELMWRYAARLGQVSEMVYSSTPDVPRKLKKSFVNGAPQVTGRILVFKEEIIYEFFDGTLGTDYLAGLKVYGDEERAYVGLIEFLKQAIGNFSDNLDYMLPVAWDLLPKNSARSSDGEYRFFDFEATYREALSKSYYILIVAIQTGETWAMSLQERFELYYKLCENFHVVPGSAEILASQYLIEVNEVIDPFPLLEQKDYLRYLSPWIFHDEVQYVSAFSRNKLQDSHETTYRQQDELINETRSELQVVTEQFRMLNEHSRLLEEQSRLFEEQARAHEEQARAHEEQARAHEEQLRLFEEQARAHEEQLCLCEEQSRLQAERGEKERQAAIAQRKRDIEEFMSSPSFRVGRALTWTPRKVIAALRQVARTGKDL